MSEDYYAIRIRKRQWWMWLLAALWLLVEVILLQTAIASHQEAEPRAAVISWIVLIVVGIAGALVWRRQGGRAEAAPAESEPPAAESPPPTGPAPEP